MRFIETFRTSASPRDALLFISDFRNLTLWDPSVTKSVGDPGRVKLGHRFTVDLVFAERPVRMDYEVTELDERAGLATLFGDSPNSTATDKVQVSKDSRTGETVVVYDAHIKLKGAYKLVDWLLRPKFAPSVTEAVDNLKRRLDNLEASTTDESY